MSIFADDRYHQLALDHREAYAQAKPFSHAVFDDFLPEELCAKVLDEFPTEEQVDWNRSADSRGVKLGFHDQSQWGETTYRVLQEFNSAPLLRFLETLTGIEGLICDPYFEGGGLHQIKRGGFLKIHADFNMHKRLGLQRRINLLLYLNRDWKDEYCGHLELWDRAMTHCVRKIFPIFNRCVVFNTTDWSYHGHPGVLACPEQMTRKSLATYYYSATRPANEMSEPHSTLYVHRPEELQGTNSVSYRIRSGAAILLDKTASLAEKPARLLRITAAKIKPSQF